MANAVERRCSATNSRGEHCRATVVNAAGFCAAHDPEGKFDAKALGKASAAARRRPNPARVHPTLRDYLRAEVAPSEVWGALKMAMEGANESARVSAARVLLDALHVPEDQQKRDLQAEAAEAGAKLEAAVARIAAARQAEGQADLAELLREAARELWDGETVTASGVIVRDVTAEQCRLVLQVLAVQRQRRNRIVAAKVAEICREEDAPLPVAAKATLAGDAQRLRGIPAVGGRGGAGGAINGSLPHVECEKIDLATVRSLAVLVRDDVDGTSPGTQPEQALLEAEEQTLAYEPRQRLEQRAARFVPTRHLVSSSGGDRARRP